MAIFCGCTAPFVWDLVRNPEIRFSQNEAQMMFMQSTWTTGSVTQGQIEIDGPIKTLEYKKL